MLISQLVRYMNRLGWDLSVEVLEWIRDTLDIGKLVFFIEMLGNTELRTLSLSTSCSAVGSGK